MIKNSNIQRLPEVTFTMISYNDEAILADCLKSIRCQTYPQSKIHIKLFDGGSTDKTENIAKTFDAEFISLPNLVMRSDLRAGMAITFADTELTCFISADNRFVSKLTLQNMVSALIDEDVLGVSTLRFSVEPNDNTLSRYFALVGGTDPAVIALDLNDKLAHDQKLWKLPNDSFEKNGRLLVTFMNKEHLFPTLGANGFLYKSSLYMNSTLAQNGFHIDMCLEASLNSKNGKFLFLKDHTIHHKIDCSLISMLKRRLLFASLYSVSDQLRIYNILNIKSAPRLALFVFKSLIFLPAIMRSIYGYYHKRDLAWFLHPIVSFCFAVIYVFLFIQLLPSKFLRALHKQDK